VEFKENFYGYDGALAKWRMLQQNNRYPCMLRDFLPWVKDNTTVDRIIKYQTI
jgi:hypothetical protein